MIRTFAHQNSTAENIGHNDATWHPHLSFAAVLRAVKVALLPAWRRNKAGK